MQIWKQKNIVDSSSYLAKNVLIIVTRLEAVIFHFLNSSWQQIVQRYVSQTPCIVHMYNTQFT